MFRQLINNALKKVFIAEFSKSELNCETWKLHFQQNPFKFLSSEVEKPLSESKLMEILSNKFPKSSVKVEDISGKTKKNYLFWILLLTFLYFRRLRRNVWSSHRFWRLQKPLDGQATPDGQCSTQRRSQTNARYTNFHRSTIILF